MSSHPYTHDRGPLTWWKGYPIFLSTYLGIFVLASMVVTAFILAFNESDSSLHSKLLFSFTNLWEKGYLWSVVTYLGLNEPSIGTLFSALILWRLGTELESYLGRRSWIQFLSILAVTSSLLLSFIGLFSPLARLHQLTSIYLLAWGTLVGFTTLQPNARFSLIITSVPAWGLTAFLFIFNVLILVTGKAWMEVVLLLASTGIAFAFLSYLQGRWNVQLPKVFQNSTPPPSGPRRSSSKQQPIQPAKFHGTVDDLLDKISQHGMHSLTKEERDFLHRESKKLAEKER